MDPLAGLAQINFCFPAGCLLIAFDETCHERTGFFRFHQIDGAAAETGSGQARPQASGQVPGNLDQPVKFGSTDLIQVAQAGVTGKHQLAKSLRPAGLEQLDGLIDAGTLFNHMPGAFVDNFG